MREFLINMINNACKNVYNQDRYLIKNDKCKDNLNYVSERSIMFRFGIYLQDYLNNYAKLKDYNLDSEYNKNLGDLKRIQDWENGAIPDIIIHKRGTNDYNVLIIEIKTWWNDNITDDLRKIDKFMEVNSDYSYKYGAVIIFRENSVEIIFKEQGCDDYKIIKNFS